MSTDVNPGIHPQVRHLTCFSLEENKILNKLGTEWYVTRGGEIWLGPSETHSSKYRYILLKPISMYQNMFNLDREIVAIFSSYENFEPRTLDAIDHVTKKFQQLRIEKVCSVIFSKNKQVEKKIRELLNDEESQIIVPISYEEILGSVGDDYYLRNKFKDHFYSRDLFAFEGPLKKELYFFGRADLIHRIVNRHHSNENSGLFGLRRSGKTSVIYGIERALDTSGAKSALIDCHDTAFHTRRWYEALWYVIFQIKKKYDIDVEINNEGKYTPKDASLLFEEDVCKISSMLGGNILLIFDEIENVTFGISPSGHWEKELDFIYFWQTLRSLYQRLDNIFSYLIVGTNPKCIEESKIFGKANPIFMSVPFEYVKPFDVPQTREMVRKLGRIMGLRFEETIYAKLTEDYGGHPFLIRHVCSVINRISDQQRPTQIGRKIYEKAKEIFDEEYAGYTEMILEVLKDFYSDEYYMLELLATGDSNDFNEFALSSPQYTNHLKGYGIIEQVSGEYDFCIDTVSKYLKRKSLHRKTSLTLEEKWDEISVRRNKLELRVRDIVRQQLHAHYGNLAKDRVLSVYDIKRKSKYNALNYKSLFDPRKCQVYIEDIRKLINRDWLLFSNIFGPDQERFAASIKEVNRMRVDAHAANISDDEMSYFRVCIGYLEKKVEDYLEGC